MKTPTARDLWELLGRIHKSRKEFIHRVGRGISWLEHSRTATDLVDRFISLWIAFNAIYSRRGKTSDHWDYEEFLRLIAEHNTDNHLMNEIEGVRHHVNNLIGNEYVYEPFWDEVYKPFLDEKERWRAGFDEAKGRFKRNMDAKNVFPVLKEIFRRIYVVRCQVFHGSATRGGKYGVPQRRDGHAVLEHLLPWMIKIMIQADSDTDWGHVYYPRVGNPSDLTIGEREALGLP